MKLGLLVAFTTDRRRARVLGEPQPLDAAIRALKELSPASATAPIVRVVSLDAVKEKAFRDLPYLEPVAGSDEMIAALAANEALKAQNATLSARIAALEAEVKAATAKPAKGRR